MYIYNKMKGTNSGNNMKVGIFLGYNPGTVLGKEGLGRYLGNLIKNIQNTGNTIIIACPQWMIGTLNNLFKDFHIEDDSVELIVESRIPIIWEIYDGLTRKRKSKDKKHLIESIVWGTDLFINGILSITNIVGLLLLGVLCLLVSVILFPFLLFGSVLYGCLLLFRSVKNRSSNIIRTTFSQISRVYAKCGQTGLNIYMQIYNHFLEKVLKRLVDKVNKVGTADVWYSPAIFWPIFNNIKAPRVINIPDLVTEEFALSWGENKEILYNTKLCEKTIDDGDKFIVYSDYVKENVVIGKFGKAKDSVVTIPHGINDLSKYVTIDSNVAGKKDMTDVFTASYCKNILQSLAKHTQGINDYINGYDFSDVDYIFYPTQARPHKNLLNLVKAYEYLLRRKYVRVKLFLTCNLDTLPEVKQYLIEHRLQYDIISFYDVSITGLAALYHQAKLVVNPTLYEGGFPFTFGEGLSVGCPSVMSRIPQVCEMTDRFNLDDILFDPYNVSDIADKIAYGLSNRENLIDREWQMYAWMQDAYSQEKIGDYYVQVFEEAVRKSS